MTIGRPPRPLADRFWEKVDRTGGPETCWEWLASKVVGYGRIQLRVGVTLKAHRVAYELEVGPIPKGLTLDHLCRNRGCVNPKHMEPVTMGENVLRGDTVTGRNQRKTHCKHGHEFTSENTYRFGPDKRFRSCRECSRLAQSGIPRRAHPFVPRPKRIKEEH